MIAVAGDSQWLRGDRGIYRSGRVSLQKPEQKECPQSQHGGSSALVENRRSVAHARRSEASASHGYLKGTRYPENIPRRRGAGV